MSSNANKIICRDYPPEFILDKNVAKEYFKQFGKLKRVTFKQKLRICTVEYVTHEGYLQALNNAGEYNGITFTVSSELSGSERKIIKKKDPIWVDKDEIEAELAAMSGIATGFSDGSYSPYDSSKLEKITKTKRSWKRESIINKPKKYASPKQNLSTTSRISGDEVDLVKLVLSQAVTAEEKYRVLDARDKLIKVKLKKLSTVKSGSTVGTCRDMCPEKERLFREIKHQVAWYEQDENSKQMNYKKAIKQYSRSSADQESPLSHDLRPVSVLQMTMGYLLHNIIDLCDADEVHIGEWFHFLWDRTRGIRKDITQQELCSQGAVELVEQCARFHIHCSARLTAEDPSVFDQKINTENLTKCLQTLKYMYHDLWLKGESCENEAEFRAYIILLNLNDGNFMWEVQQLRPEIQRSTEVRFAIQVYSSIDKNNYVQFFKLVRSTTYLNACILMRYFVQIRVTALKYLLKCYLLRAAQTVYPLNKLRSILAFDDLDATKDFMLSYGLDLNHDGTHVVLNKNNFALPEIPYMLDRSMVIEDKRIFSVGKIICGKDLPPKTYSNHKIHNSFDPKGYLINKDFLDERDLENVKLNLLEELDRSKEEVKETVDDDALKKTEEEKLDKPSVFDKKESFSFAENDSSSNPFALTNKQSGSLFGATKTLQVTESIFASSRFTFHSPVTVSSLDQTDFVPKMKDIFSSGPPQESDPEPKKGGFSFNLPPAPSKIELPRIPSVPQVEIDLKRQKELEDQKLKLSEQKDLEVKKRKEKERLLKLKLEEARKNELKRQAAKIKEEERELTKRRQEELQRLELQRKQHVKDEEIKDAVKGIISSLISRVDDAVRKEKLSKITENIKTRKLLKMVRKWRFNVSINKRKRKAIDCSPGWINAKTLQRSAEELHSSSQDLTLTLMKRYKYGKPLEIATIVDEQLRTINLYYLTYSILRKRILQFSVTTRNDVFWKVVISLPNESELTNGLRRLEETMDSAFSWKKIQGQTLSLEHVRINTSETVTYCVEKQQGSNVTHYDCNGIIFIAKNFNANLQRRIFDNLKGFGVYTKVPIVLVLQEFNENDCKLEELIKENIVSAYVILKGDTSAPRLLSAIEEGLVFLAKNVENDPPLELDDLKSFMKTYLCSEIWKRANSFAKWNSDYKKCLQQPNTVVDLYNEGLTKLKSIVLNESMKEHAEFPGEFKKYLTSEVPTYLPCSYRYFPKFWRSESYFNDVEKILKDVELPVWRDVWPPLSEHDLELSVFKYCSKITKEPESLFYRVMSLFGRNFQDIRNVLWTDVIELLSLEKLSNCTTCLGGEFQSQSIFKEAFVVYNINELNAYRFCDWFYLRNSKIKRCIEKDVENRPTKKYSEKRVKDFVENLKLSEDFIETIRNNLLTTTDRSEMLRELKALNKSLDDLTDSVAVHKRISFKMEECLTRAIEEK